jgi:serine/threonine-protein kinase
MGVVYLAEDPVLNRQVALKTVDLAIDDPAQRNFLCDRLLRDARAAAALSHPNVVGVYDVLMEDDTAYLVMEYVAGETLAQRLAAGPPPDSAMLSRVLGGIAAALDYAHARGVVHRDVKPANVMLDAHGMVKLMDFGIARVNDGATVTAAGTVMGTVQYMAPEQIKGEAVDGRADQFSLAAVAYEMLTGSTLFGHESFATLAYKIVNETPQPIRVRRPELPEGVDQVLMRALRKNPTERFADCTKFVEAMTAALANQPVADAAATQTILIPPPARRRSPAIWALLGVLVATGAGVGAFVWKPWARSTPAIQTSVTTQAPVPPPPPPAASTAIPPVTPGVINPAPAHPKPAPTPPLPSKEETVTQAPADIPPERDIPPEALPLRQQATEKMESGDFPAALEILNKAIQRHPKLPWAYTMRGHCYVRMKNDQAALADFNQVLQLRSESPAALDARGLIYSRAKEYDKAVRDFSEAIRLQPDAAAYYQHRGAARRASGDQAGARADFTRFRELNPNKKEQE